MFPPAELAQSNETLDTPSSDSLGLTGDSSIFRTGIEYLSFHCAFCPAQLCKYTVEREIVWLSYVTPLPHGREAFSMHCFRATHIAMHGERLKEAGFCSFRGQKRQNDLWM